MILNSLKIHNIASIEDATINFNCEPLVSSELFLISGKTGSGKSTILDAICLALYGDTPRMKSTKKSGKTEEELFVDDVRQLMRRNTGQAYVILEFEGNNAVEYTATWSISRAYNKIDGKIQEVSRSLLRHSDNTNYHKKTDIEQEIASAIGLDFNQFCRTTMLAQGQFTQFLNSDDKEKAAILEKITGVDIYTKIGKKVFEITREKEQAKNAAFLKTEGLTFLNDEEIEEINRKKEELLQKNNSFVELSKIITEQLEWLNRNEELESSMLKARQNYEISLGQYQSEEMTQKQELVSNWKDTIEVRNFLTNIELSNFEAESAKQALEERRSIFAACLNKKLTTEALLAENKTTLSEISERILAYSPKESAIANAQTIITHLKNLIQGRTKINSYKAELNLLSEQAKILEKELTSKKNILDEKNKFYAIKCTELQEAEKIVNSFPMEELRKQSDALSRKTEKISIANERLLSQVRDQERVNSEKKNIQDLNTQISDLQKLIKDFEPELNSAKLILDERKRTLDQQLNTIDKWSKKVRTELKPGDICPVCQQPIAELPHETALDEIFQKAKIDLNAAEEEYNKLNDKLIECQNNLKLKLKMLEKAQKDFESATNALSATTASLSEILKELEIEIGENAQTQLVALKTKLENELSALTKSISEGEAAEQKAKEARKAQDNARNEAERAKADSENKSKEIDKVFFLIKSSEGLREQKSKEISGIETDLSTLISNKDEWTYDWLTNSEEFVKELNAKVLDYKKLCEEKVQVISDITNTESLLQRVDDSIKGILNSCPSWKEQTASDSSVDKLESTLGQLRSDVATFTSRLADALQNKAHYEQLVQDYLSNNQKYSIEILLGLSKHKLDEINSITNEIEQLRTSLDSTKSLLDNNIKLKAEHETKKPQFTEEQTKESLSQQITDIANAQNSINQELGAIKHKLESNEESKAKLKNLLLVFEQANNEYERWSKLNTLIGDSSGNRFRTIAQSYVLSALINTANHYMNTLAPRYKLYVQAGEFVISIEDAYQGYSRRAVSTISGGESFLVSLSLALALSDIGQNLSVDTLFIDEGFGTLSGEHLLNAINTLHQLHSQTGRHVGIISHVEELRERIGVQIKVEQQAHSSSSTISVESL